MTKLHRHKLIPAGKSSRMPLGLRLLHRLLKFSSRKNLERLIKDAAKSVHGTDLLNGFSVGCTDIIYRTRSRLWSLPAPNLDRYALKEGTSALFKSAPVR